MLFRQGDLFIESAEAVPEGTIRRDSGVLLEGELTGHSHRIDDAQSAVVYERLDQMFIEVIGERAAIVHQEHATIVLPRGVYRAWRQRQYDPLPAAAAPIPRLPREAAPVPRRIPSGFFPADRVGSIRARLIALRAAPMFGWMKSLAVWSPEDARRRIWAGDAPARMRIAGNLELAHSPFLKELPPGLQAIRIDVSGCQNLRSLPAGLQCQELIIRGSGVERLPPDLNVSMRIDARECRRLQLIPRLQVDDLNLRGCTALDELANGLRVRRLDISGCARLTRVPASTATTLEHLNASGCVGLTTLPEQLTSLEEARYQRLQRTD